MMPSFKPVTHVIFDMDGLLFDTDRVHIAVCNTIAEKYGRKYTWETRAKFMGRSSDAIQDLINEMDLPLTVQEYQAEARAALFSMHGNGFLSTKPKAGVERLVKHLSSSKIPIAIATSSKKETYDMKVKNNQELIHLFHHTLFGDEVKHGKPAPDIFLACANLFDEKPNPEKVLVFEDSPSGIHGAIEAGMQAVMIPDPCLPSKYCKEATLVISSMDDFRPEFFGLPAYL